MNGFQVHFRVPCHSSLVHDASVSQVAKETGTYPALLNLRSPDAKKEFANTMVEIFNGERYVPRDEQGRGRRQRKRRQSRGGR